LQLHLSSPRNETLHECASPRDARTVWIRFTLDERHGYPALHRCANAGQERARRLADDGATAGRRILPGGVGESPTSAGDSAGSRSSAGRKDPGSAVGASGSPRLVGFTRPLIERTEIRAARAAAAQSPHALAGPSYMTFHGSPTASRGAAPYGTYVASVKLEYGGNV